MKSFSKIITRFGMRGARSRGKPGMRAYAVGDVHGCLVHLKSMIALIEADIKDYSGTVYLVFLGDLIDRGPQSSGVIDLLRTYQKTSVRTIFLMGNHEEFLIRSLAGETGVIARWLEHGGAQCVESYGLDAGRLAALDETRASTLLRETIPTSHQDFLRSFGDTFSFGDYLFVHAGIRPGLALDLQEQSDLRWIREPFLSHRGDHGRMIVHGHTISDGVDEQRNRIGIDTGAYRGGPLTALVVEGEERRFLSTGGQA